VSADLLENVAGWGRVQNALAEIRASHGEFQDFFAGVFDELDSFSTQLAERQQQWQSQRQQTEEELARQREHLEEQRAAITAQAEQARHENAQETSAALESSRQVAQLLDELRRERAELREMQDTIGDQLGRLAAAAAELAEIQKERPDNGTTPAADEQHEKLLEEARRRQAEWEKERAVLEAELEAVRDRAAEMSESLAEQQRLAGQQQAEWNNELKRMRGMLEHVSRQLSQQELPTQPADVEPEPPPVPRAVEEPPAENEDAALSSVMAQFEMLQRDLARRRATGP